MARNKYETVFRAKKQGKLPRVGIAQDVQEGDWITYFDDHQFTVREVEAVHHSHVTTAPLTSEYGVLDGEKHRVKFSDIIEAQRPIREDPPVVAVSSTEDTSEVLDFLDGD